MKRFSEKVSTTIIVVDLKGFISSKTPILSKYDMKDIVSSVYLTIGWDEEIGFYIDLGFNEGNSYTLLSTEDEVLRNSIFNYYEEKLESIQEEYGILTNREKEGLKTDLNISSQESRRKIYEKVLSNYHICNNKAQASVKVLNELSDVEKENFFSIGLTNNLVRDYDQLGDIILENSLRVMQLNSGRYIYSKHLF